MSFGRGWLSHMNNHPSEWVYKLDETWYINDDKWVKSIQRQYVLPLLSIKIRSMINDILIECNSPQLHLHV